MGLREPKTAEKNLRGNLHDLQGNRLNLRRKRHIILVYTKLIR